MARPKKSGKEKYLVKSIRFPPALWEELAALVPAGERSAFIQAELARGLRRARRRAAKERTSPAGPAEGAVEEQAGVDVEERPWFEEVLDEVAAIPAAERGPVRVDGSEQHDHYIYGVPKRPRL